MAAAAADAGARGGDPRLRRAGAEPARPSGSDGPLLVLLDGGWARRAGLGGADGPGRGGARRGGARRAAGGGGVDGRAAAGRGGAAAGASAGDWSERLAGLAPQPWAPDRRRLGGMAGGAGRRRLRDAVAVATGWATAARPSWPQALLDKGPVTLAAPPRPALALTPAAARGGRDPGGRRCAPTPAAPTPVAADRHRPRPERDRAGARRRDVAGSRPARTGADVALDLPIELRNRVAQVRARRGRARPPAVVLADDAVRRRKVGLMSGRRGRRGAGADRPAALPARGAGARRRARRGAAGRDAEHRARRADPGRRRRDRRGRARADLPWVEAGGAAAALRRAAAGASGAGQLEDDPLLPVRLRAGGRVGRRRDVLGRARKLRPSRRRAPFFGLAVPEDVDVSAQVVAQPDPDLPERVLAQLEDGTPLVTARRWARARWCCSTSPPTPTGRPCRSRASSCRCWSGWRRAPAASGRPRARRWRARSGRRCRCSTASASWGAEPRGRRAGRAAGRRAAPAGPAAGALCRRRAAGGGQRGARRATRWRPGGRCPTGVVVEALDRGRETPLGPWLLALALVLLRSTCWRRCALSGRLRARRRAARRRGGGGAAARWAVGAAGAAAGGAGQPEGDARGAPRGERDGARPCR